MSVVPCVVIIAVVLSVAMLPVAHTSYTLELVGVVPPTDGISIEFIEAMEILDSNPEELFFTTKNQGAHCGGGTPASVWKMTIDQNTGEMISVELIQMLSKIQSTQYDLFESSDGTLFTGGGWCGYKPAYYSTDAGETWQSADSGPVHPPNSVRSFVEFNGDVYAGTGYEPYHGEVYRWLGNGNWEKVLDTGTVRNIVDAMVVYDNKLFVGSKPYGDSGSACASTIPVLVSSDGNTFNTTTGIPGCYNIESLLVVGNKLVALVWDRVFPHQRYVYHWNDISETWEEVAAEPNLASIACNLIVSHNGVIYAYGQAPSDTAAGIYESVDLGLTWQQIAVLENPDAVSMTIHGDALYLGTHCDANNNAYIYRLYLRAQLNVASLPVTGIPFTVDGETHYTPYTEMLSEGSYTVEMPEIYDEYVCDEYVWSHWLEDGDTNRTKTVTLPPDSTWTAMYTSISWEHIFQDERRNTTLKISTDDNYFRFIAPNKTFSVRHDPDMTVGPWGHLIVISYEDSEMKLWSLAVDTRIDFCIAFAKDLETGRFYWLVDRPDGWLCGDIDNDGDVDYYDFMSFAAAYGSSGEQPRYNARADFDGDDRVDYYDFISFADNYGKTAN